MILVVCANPSVDTLLGLDQLKAGQSQRSLFEKKYAGGKGLHVAMALKELGHRAQVFGVWAGATGQWMKDELSKIEIESFGIEVAGENRVCLTLKTLDAFNDTEILGSGPQVSDVEYLKFESLFQKQILRADCQGVLFCGSLPPGFPIDAYARSAKLIPALIPWALDTSGATLFKTLELATPDLLHVNASEAFELTSKQEISEQIFELQKKCRSLALTRGSEGLWFCDDDENIFHGAVKIDVRASSVGSGDCLTAGVFAAMISGESTEMVTRLGVACGAANCLRDELGLFFKSDVDDLLEKVKIEPIVTLNKEMFL